MIFEPTPSPSPSPTPSPTAVVSEFEYGDVNCDRDRTAVDGLALMQYAAGVMPEQGEPCAEIGEAVDIPEFAGGGQQKWGDINCDGDVDVDDALALIGDAVFIPYDKPPNCPETFDGILIS